MRDANHDLRNGSVAAGPAGDGSFLANLKYDLPASIVVFLVALPLCMGIAIASGMPPSTGLITGIVGGIIVGALSGAPLQVSGPAAGLSVMVYEIVQRDGAGALGVIVLVGGMIQLAAGLLKFGQWFRAVSPAVIRGMLTGIGILIFASQFHVMVDDAPRSNGLKNIIAIPEAVYKGVVPMDDSSHHLAAMLGLISIGILMVWKPLVGRLFKRLKVVPSALIAVIVATGAAWAMGWGINRVEIADNMLSTISWLPLTDLSRLLDGQILLAGVAVAFVASAETLLCATAVDNMHSGPRCKYDKELSAQGIGNMICGLAGALPMTGVIVRSATNVEAGGRTRSSAILHGVWILVFVIFLTSILRMIPTSALAAILVYTGVKLMDFKAPRQLAQYGKGEVAIFLVTVAMIVGADLLTGVLIGVGLSAAKLLYTFSRIGIRIEDEPDRNCTSVWLTGTATFVVLPKLAAALECVRPNTELHLHLERLEYIDHACLELLMSWEAQHSVSGGQVVIDWEYLTAKTRKQVIAPVVGGEAHHRPRPHRETVEV